MELKGKVGNVEWHLIESDQLTDDKKNVLTVNFRGGLGVAWSNTIHSANIEALRDALDKYLKSTSKLKSISKKITIGFAIKRDDGLYVNYVYEIFECREVALSRLWALRFDEIKKTPEQRQKYKFVRIVTYT